MGATCRAQQDQAHVEQALAAIPKRRRPCVQLADPEYLNASPVTSAAESRSHVKFMKTEAPCYHLEVDLWDGLWQVERTFVHCTLPATASEGSRAAQSEPWGGVEDSQPLKLRRLSHK